jgi:hypothetical protein
MNESVEIQQLGATVTRITLGGQELLRPRKAADVSAKVRGSNGVHRKGA